ncbi:hypothetical protein QBC43DRAFT_378927 [Cladorrhinum sp. PSN259]|nr:hypothetical protein QBC43DRAFT_378927 [Cladorrhinum sp. PSN259]
MATPTNTSPSTPIWLITGASSGFGDAIAREALSRGHRVIATARSQSKLTSLRSLGASVLPLDVTSSESDLAAVVKQAASIYGAITHVANCAGYILEGAAEETTQKEVYDVFNTNVFGTVNIARAVTPYLRDAAKQGHKPALATFGSLGSWRSGAAVSLYCSTKFAVTGLSEGLYDELKPFGISVCCVEPGYTRTGFLSTSQDGEGTDHRMKTAKQLDVYHGTVAASTRDAMNAYNGQQPGDVNNCAIAIVDVLTREGMAADKEVPVRLVLGSDCLETTTRSPNLHVRPAALLPSPRYFRMKSRTKHQCDLMDPTETSMLTSSSTPALTAPPPTPGTPATPRTPPLKKAHSVAHSVSSTHREYLDSLHVPSKEEFQHIAEIQAGREAEQKRRNRQLRRESQDLSPAATPSLDNGSGRPGHSHRRSFLSKLGFGHRSSPSEDGREKAATLIQRTYRGYRVRREIRGLSLDASTRWMHAVQEAQWRQLTRPRPRSAQLEDGFSYFRPASSDGGAAAGGVDDANNIPNGSRSPAARSRWKKASTVARRAGGDADKSSTSSSSSSSSDSDSDELEKGQKKLEKQHLKHRYGSNLRVYHEAWQRASTNENFFYWLDHGEGRNVDIEACPRETLDREQVRYLSREERQHYLVQVDEEGRLCWAKNGARIDTTEKWKDSINGIVPNDDLTPAYVPVAGGSANFLGGSNSSSSSSLSSSSSSSDSEDERAANHYATPEYSQAKGVKKIKHVSASTIFNKLLRKSVRKNTWIFVADTSFRLYVGIKNSGAFQHSSFLQGSRISAAGLIKIKNGKLHSLSPLSGHYRPPASNFKAFVNSLKEEGVNMGSVSISKSYAILVGLEAYAKVSDRMKKVGHKRDKASRSDLMSLKEQDVKESSPLLKSVVFSRPSTS